MNEQTAITADGHVLTWREYIDEQMALDADEPDEGIPFAAAECPPLAEYMRIITHGIARAAAVLIVALVPLATMLHGGAASADTLTAEDGTQVGPHFYDPDADADGWRDAIDPMPNCPAIWGPSHTIRHDYGRAECSADATAEDGSHVPADYYNNVDLTPVCAAIGDPDPRADCYAKYPDQTPATDEQTIQATPVSTHTATPELGYGATQIVAGKAALADGYEGTAFLHAIRAYKHMKPADYAKAYSRADTQMKHVMARAALFVLHAQMHKVQRER